MSAADFLSLVLVATFFVTAVVSWALALGYLTLRMIRSALLERFFARFWARHDSRRLEVRP